jgi:nucleoside-diphosphate-sugar epimerase
MNILITGATGFIGSLTADVLAAQGHNIRCNIRKSSNLRWLKDKGFDLVDVDFQDLESIKKAVKDVDMIYHIAGATFARDEAEFMQSNRDATRNLIEVAHQECPNLKRFLFVSSQTVAGPAKSLEQPVTEDMPPNPLTAYGRSKKAAEDEVLKFEDIMPITIVRSPAVYGPRDTAILDMYKIVQKGIGPLIGLKPKYISLIHGEDLARGIIMAAESPNTVGEIYYVTSSTFYSWHTLMDTMKYSLGKTFLMKIKIPHSIVVSVAASSEFISRFKKNPNIFNRDKGRDFIQQYWICSNAKAIKDFGFIQEIELKEGMKQTADWYKQQGWLQ